MRWNGFEISQDMISGNGKSNFRQIMFVVRLCDDSDVLSLGRKLDEPGSVVLLVAFILTAG